MDTVLINTNNKMMSPQHYSVFDSYLEGNKMIRLSQWSNIAIIEDWAIKRDNIWERYAISIGPEWNLDKISEVQILDIEHIRVVADGKTTIYTIDYEKNTCSSDDEKK